MAGVEVVEAIAVAGSADPAMCLHFRVQSPVDVGEPECGEGVEEVVLEGSEAGVAGLVVAADDVVVPADHQMRAVGRG
jgi:hypothetical protein